MSSPHASRYGGIARIGIGTPQANPTVEAEMGILLPRGCSLHVTRLTSGEAAPEARLQAYLLRLEEYLAAYDTLRPDVFGFACTASAYLLGAGEEERLTAAARARCGYPVETASRAAVWALHRMNARRIAFVAAYSSEMVEAGCRYLEEAGIEVVRRYRLNTATADTRGIYELGSDRLAAVLQTVPRDDIDAVLVSGTGLASLPALRGAGAAVVSSNLCLAARLLDLIGRTDWLHAGTPFIRGWEQRLDEALSSAP